MVKAYCRRTIGNSTVLIRIIGRGGEWYPENSGSRKFLLQSRNLGGVFNESRNLVFLYFFASRILEFFGREVSESWSFVFLANDFDQNHDNKQLLDEVEHDIMN